MSDLPTNSEPFEEVAGFPEVMGEPVEVDFGRPLARPRSSRRWTPKRRKKAASEAATVPARKLDPRNGTWLDFDLRLIRAEGTALLSSVLATLDAAEPAKAVLRRDHRENFERRVDCILVNALRAHFYRESGRVSYNTSNHANQGERWHSSPSLRDTIDLMVRAGLIERQGGVSAPYKENAYAATFWLAQPLKGIIADLRATALTVGKPAPPVTSLIHMGKGQGGTRSQPIAKGMLTEESDQWAADLDRYNRFADDHVVYLDMDARKADKALVASYNRKLAEAGSRQPGITQPEYFDRHLRRVFNDGTFAHGGRLYGAWYQRASQWLWATIIIDDDPTVELDFSGMSVRMIYHRYWIEYLDDPYSIAELEAAATRQGHDKDHYRGSVKRLVQATLNNEDDDKRPEMITLEQRLPRGFTRARVRDLILAKHEPIREAFGLGLGKQLQRLDSDIAFDVILKLMDRDILCLPVHDSFLVGRRHRDVLHQQMVDSYLQQLPFPPVIKEQGTE